MAVPADAPVLGVILAGGRAGRLGGGDKGRLAFGGGSLLDAVIDRLGRQVDGLILNANGDAARFADLGLPVVADAVGGFAGPLAGVSAALDWARRHRPEVAQVVSVACDTPFLPPDLVARLCAAAVERAVPIACAASGGRTHPVVALWPVALADRLGDDLAGGQRKVDRWQEAQGLAVVDFATDPVDPFHNINTPEDLADARRLLAGP